MKSCVYCGRENQDEAVLCCECGTGFAIPDPPLAQVQEKVDGVAEALEPECDVAPDGEAALCTSCLFPNVPDSRWCKRCGAPLSSNTMIVMPEAAWAAGFVYRRAVEAPPNLVVVLGIWMHFCPGFVLSALMLFTFVGGDVGGLFGLAGILSAIGGGAVCGSMLYRVTRNYFRVQKTQSIEKTD